MPPPVSQVDSTYDLDQASMDHTVTPTHDASLSAPGSVEHQDGKQFKHLEAVQLPRKLLIQMSGAPGSGKSTIGNLLARSINAVSIDHDVIKTFFLANGEAFYQSAKHAYDFQWVLAEDMIQKGWSVIIDSTCNYQETLNAGTTLAQKYGYDYKYIECKVTDIDLLETRLRNRPSLRSQRKSVNDTPTDVNTADDTRDPRAVFEKWMTDPCRPADDNIILIDSTLSPERCLQNILKQIVSHH